MLMERKKGKYAHVLSSDGTLRINVPEGTEGAVKRDYETSDGKKGTKYELVYEAVKGYISKMAFYDGDFGKTLNLRIIDAEHEPITLVFNTTTAFGEDVMRKLPNVNLKEEIVIRPYAFTDEENRIKKGVAITQGNKKINNFFYDPTTKKPVNGFPLVEGVAADYDKEDWKMHFMKCRKFLITYVEQNILGKVVKRDDDHSDDDMKPVEYPTEDINPEDIPF